MNSSELQHLIQKLYNIDKNLGGVAEKTKKAKKSKEFDVIKEALLEQIFLVNKLQNQRDESMSKYGNDRDLIKLGVRIRDGIREAEGLIERLREAVVRMSKNKKKFSQAEIDLRLKLVANYQVNVENLKSRELGEKVEETDSEKPMLVKDYQKKLFEKDPNREVVYKPTREEQEALDRFEQNDQLIDEKAGQVIIGMDQLKLKAQAIGQKIDQTHAQIGGLTKEVDKTNETLLTSNKKLKELLIKVCLEAKQFRQPNKFCLDITLFLLFLGIIGVIVNMAYKK